MTQIPSTSSVLRVLFRADMTTQWRNRRSAVLSLVVPVIILIALKNAVDTIGANYALSTCITIGVAASCLMGYTNALARDRDKGVFQRLRVGPVPTWTIMGSRLLVQMMMIFFTAVAVFLAGYYVDHIQIALEQYLLGLLATLVAGVVYLGLAQLLVGLIKNPETVNSTTRLVYLVFIVVGLYGGSGKLGTVMQQITLWSPYGTVSQVLAASMRSGAWNQDITNALLVALGYAVVFAGIGIRKFSWSSR